MWNCTFKCTISVLLLSGCRDSNVVANDQTNTEQPTITSSAIVMENGNAMIVDLQSYKKYSVDLGSDRISSYVEDRTWVLYTSTGDKLLVDYDSVNFIEGENSHEKAETIAQALIGESGLITCYDEVQSYGRGR